MSNMAGMMKRIQQLQEAMDRIAVESAAGGGVVKVTMNGRQEVLGVKIDPQVIDPSDAETLEDLVRAAVNEALQKSRDAMKGEVSKLTGGMPLPPGLF